MKIERGSDWTLDEVKLTVEAYLRMLKEELAGQPYNKAAENRWLVSQLNSRTRTSVEYKMQNISAVLGQLNLVRIRGYKPMPNAQAVLRLELERQLLLDNVLFENMRGVE